MSDNRWHDAIWTGLQDSGLIRNLRRISDANLNASLVIEGEVSVEENEVTVCIWLSLDFPLRLPHILLRPGDALGFIPHVDVAGTICFADPEGLLFDQHNPLGLVLDSLQRAIQVLKDGVTGANKKDFVEEFDAHWGRIKGAKLVVSILTPKDEICRIIVAHDQNAGTTYVADSEANINSYYNRPSRSGQLTVENGLYVPLHDGTLIVPPHPDQPFWTQEVARQILTSNLPSDNLKNLEDLLAGQERRVKYIIVKLSRFSGGESLFGLRYGQIGNKHPLLAGGIAEKIEPLVLARLDRGYLVQRGGGYKELSAKSVLLVGCGAVGGHLAFELAKAGISNITLVDEDILKPENTYRHILGKQYWLQPKVQALKQELEAQLPYLSIKVYKQRIEQLLRERLIDLAQYDLVVLATGNPTVELYVNALIHKQQKGPIALFSWLEPLGIGGHALLVNNAPTGGCFECLYTSLADDAILENRAAFAAAGQSFGRALSGCGSLHTPYGSMDAVHTAVIAARLAVDALSGKEYGNPLISWKNDATTFLQEGFNLSNRYQIPDVDLFHNRYLYRTDRCLVCGNRVAQSQRRDDTIIV